MTHSLLLASHSEFDIQVGMVLQYDSYDSDITCSFPANGHFTDDQKVRWPQAFVVRTA